MFRFLLQYFGAFVAFIVVLGGLGRVFDVYGKTT